MAALKTSVALATFNGARYLEKQLDSIVSQSRPPDQVVIFDDQSTDATRDILETFRNHSGLEVRVSYNPRNLGSIGNFERAAQACTGDIILLCDQDDVWRHDKVALLAGRFEASESLTLLYSNARLVDSDGCAMGLTQFQVLKFSTAEARTIRRGRALDVLLRRNLVTGATVAFRRTLLRAAAPFPSEWVHDEWLALIAALTGQIDFCEDELVDYRQHGGNQLGLRARDLAERLRDVVSPRGDFYHGEVQRMAVLHDRAKDLQKDGMLVSSADLIRLEGALVHARARAELPKQRLRRLPGIARELTTGRYWKFSLGFRSVVRDAVEQG